MNLLLRWVLNACALLATAYLLKGIQLSGVESVLWAALVLGIVNAVIRPFLLLLTLPLNILTLGLFTFVINGITLLFTASLVPGFHVDGLWAAIVGSVVLSIISAILSSLFKDKD